MMTSTNETFLGGKRLVILLSIRSYKSTKTLSEDFLFFLSRSKVHKTPCSASTMATVMVTTSMPAITSDLLRSGEGSPSATVADEAAVPEEAEARPHLPPLLTPGCQVKKQMIE
jgi:hypothetical protein